MSQYNLGSVAFPGGHTTSEPTDPWRSQATSVSSEAGPAAPAEEPHTSSTPKVSGVVRNPSPTTLPEFTTPATWEWQGISYDTIEEAANAAAPTTVPNDVKEWVMNVVRAFIMRDIVSSYEALRQKMDERHEHTVASLEEEIMAHIHVEIMAVETRDQLKVARAQIGTLSADIERLVKANNNMTLEAQAIRKDFKNYKDKVKGQMDALYENMVTLKEAQEKTMTYIVGLESQLNNTIINVPPTDPPKYSGRKSSENFETWFTNLLIWLDYNHFTDDKDKIRQANAHLEGGAALYMKEYAIKLASEQDVGTWAEYTRKLEMAYKMLDPKHMAQAMLDAHCTTRHKTMIAFTENFRAYAPESGYSDEDLIVKIREQWLIHIQMVMSVTETLDPSKIPTTWMDYLEFCLEIEIKHLQQILGNKSTGQTMATKATTPKDPNAMDTSARITYELSPKQDRWLTNKLCKGKGKAQKVRQVEEEGSSDTSPQIVALEQAIAALCGMSTTSTTPPSSKDKNKAKGTDAASTASASTASASMVKDTNARINELDKFSENFLYEV
ncbi:uncharacterized protein LAESUDRAFT_763402 [Laetiporus sulphureus 93-53]|uniref:Retrotransposon gag domain-containing protein n=1 Tax=Laetiporus sulphureus 93-53 TaxID=1314785 RepID=A0A165BX76_9APHY|nr:uncharacterized protein LAESUDRAFT_763402 [Laetiporus sulphureus 93-53]KZT01815.1 hypothetical protein LAESUDRAFT_763402 [Laetiporus sulphureus 93-53]